MQFENILNNCSANTKNTNCYLTVDSYIGNHFRNILLKIYQCTSGSNQCKTKINLLYRYLIPLNQSHPELVTNELIKQLLTHYLPVVLPNKIISDGDQDISRYWNLYIDYNVENFIPTLIKHLRELYETIKTPNFAQYQHMIKYYKAVNPMLNKEMYKFKDYYLEMINNYYHQNLIFSHSTTTNIDGVSGNTTTDIDSIQMMLEIWYSYLCLCGDQNQNQLEFSKFLCKQLKGEQLVKFICLFNKNYFDNKTFNVDAFVLLCESLFDESIEENNQYLLNLDKQSTNTLIEIFKLNPKFNLFLNNFKKNYYLNLSY